MLSAHERRFVDAQAVGRLATADRDGSPHVVPVCYARVRGAVYITVDRKPKRAPGRALKRERNIRENPAVALVVDRYADDWSRLGWVLMRGTAEILEGGEEHAVAQRALRRRYAQYRGMRLADLPVIAIRIERVASWGDLAPDP